MFEFDSDDLSYFLLYVLGLAVIVVIPIRTMAEAIVRDGDREMMESHVMVHHGEAEVVDVLVAAVEVVVEAVAVMHFEEMITAHRIDAHWVVCQTWTVSRAAAISSRIHVPVKICDAFVGKITV